MLFSIQSAQIVKEQIIYPTSSS